MYSYHIVAELRQFRGVCPAAGGRIHRGWQMFANIPEQNPAIPV